MFRKVGLPIIALIGLGFAIFMIYYGAKKPPVASVLFAPPSSPYKHYVAGEGMIEAASENIGISTPIPELVTSLYVKVGDVVPKGTPLFSVDTRKLEAQLEEAQKQLVVAQTDYENRKKQFSFYERLKNKAAVSELDYQKYYYDMKITESTVEKIKALINVIQTDIKRSTVRAPIDGEVLQINIRLGQFANINPFDRKPLILFGDTSIMHMRISIDEDDVWRIIPGAPAMAFVRGNSRITIPLEFDYIEPYVIPKPALSGGDTERVDTRVFQLVYRFKKGSYPVHIGQLLDVFIEAKSSEAAL